MTHCPLCDHEVIGPEVGWRAQWGWVQHRWEWHLRKNHPGWHIEYKEGELKVVRDD